MRVKLAALAIGAVFGATLSWTGMSSPEVIRDALLFRDGYLFLMFGSAVATAFVGLRLLRAGRERAILVDKPVRWETDPPRREHFAGSVVFGTGWAIAGACPGPIATQLGQGVVWSLFTIAGLAAGIALYLRRERAAPTRRSSPSPRAASARPASSGS